MPIGFKNTYKIIRADALRSLVGMLSFLNEVRLLITISFKCAAIFVEIFISEIEKFVSIQLIGFFFLYIQGNSLFMFAYSR